MDNRVMIFKAPDSFVCNNYLCREMSGQKYYIGNYYGAESTCDVYCEACVKHLVSTIPSSLAPEKAAVENQLRSEITAEYEIKLAQILHDRENTIREQAAREIAMQMAETQTLTPIPFTDEVEEEANTTIYRCLDCMKEFDSPQKLGSHRQVHNKKAGK